MRLHSIELQDVGRFGSLKASLAGQQVGIVGPNGAGKSTILSSIYYAVTGDLGRLGKGDAVNTLRDKPSEQPFVRLLLHPGSVSEDPAIVIRKLPADGKDGTRRMVYGDRTWTAQADLADRFEVWTGLSAKAMAEFVFVPQGGLDHVVRAPAPRRAEILQRVFGVAHAEKICEAARERLTRLPAPPDAGVLAALRAGAAEAIGVADRAAQDAQNIRLPDPADEANDRAVVAAYVDGEAAHTSREAAVAALSAVQMSEPTRPETQDPPAIEFELVEKMLGAWKIYTQREEAAGYAQRVSEQAQAAATWRPTSRDPGPRPEPPAELLALRGRKFTFEVIRAAPPGEVGVCPVCSGHLTPDAADASAASANLTRLAQLEAEYTATIAAHDEAGNTFDRDGQRFQTLQHQAREAAAQAAAARAIVGTPPSYSEAHVKQFLAQLRGVQGEWVAYRRAEVAYRARLAEAERVLSTCRVVVRVPEIVATLAKIRLDSAAQTHAARAVAQSRADALREAADAAIETVRQAEARTASSIRIARWRDRVEEIRRVFHRDAAPAAAVRACLEGLSVDLNRRLGNLAATFRVRMGPDGELHADYRDGTRTRSVPADRISGGEGAVLGLAWRLALLDRYAPKVGLLCLDEPTTGLDGDRVSALRSALEAWRPHGSDRQFVIVTHERKLLPVFDSVVDLGTG